MDIGTRKAFGGHWSDDKLSALAAYMQSYCTVLKKSRFDLVYIDAFAGSGRTEIEAEEGGDDDGLFEDPRLLEEEADYRHGSPLLALECEPPFDRFVFIDSNEESLGELKIAGQCVRQIERQTSIIHLRGCQREPPKDCRWKLEKPTSSRVS